MLAQLRNDRHQTDLGRIAAWANGDEDGAPSNGKGNEPVKYTGDTPDDRLRDVLLWLFLPSVVGVVSLWVWLHSWLNLSSGYGWAFVGMDLVLYVVIGWRGRQLFLFTARLLGRPRRIDVGQGAQEKVRG